MATALPQSPTSLDKNLPKNDGFQQSLSNDAGSSQSPPQADDEARQLLSDTVVHQTMHQSPHILDETGSIQSPPNHTSYSQSLPQGDHETSHLQSETENHQKLPEEKNKDYPPDGLPNTTARANMPGFMFETKYVMLNFMGLIPPELYTGHVATPDSLASSELSTCDLSSKSNNLFLSRSHSSLSKSQSVDSVLLKSHAPKLKHINKVKHFHQSQDSPASDDNTNYRYKLNCEQMDLADDDQSDIPEVDDQDVDVSDAISPSMDDLIASVSPRRSNLYRVASEASSSGDYSYSSDADDELEDFSNASSIFSGGRSIKFRDGFLDIRRGSPRQTGAHRGEADVGLDDVDGGHLSCRHSCELQDVPEEQEMPDEPTESAQAMGDRCAMGLVHRRQPDRSKLRLEIPCQPVQLSDILVSLGTELNSEMSEMETEYEEAVRSSRASMHRRPPSACATPLTPQTQAAQILARIGDEVRDQYEDQISSAVNRYMLQEAGRMSYQTFREIATEIVDISLPGWRQVALLFVFGQHIVMRSMQSGQTKIENIFDYLVRLVADEAADFIIKQGGFGAVMNSDPSQSSSDALSSSMTDADSPQCVIDYFTDHNVTQVESSEILADHAQKPDDPADKVKTTDENSNDTGSGIIGCQLGLNSISLISTDEDLQSVGSLQTGLTAAKNGPSGGNSLAPLADVHKDRLKSFGFDVQGCSDPDNKEEQGDQSLDCINYVSTVVRGEKRDSLGNISASNSDIFIEVDDGNISSRDVEIDEEIEESNSIPDITEGWDDPAKPLISDNRQLSGPYERDSVYVNQETPTPRKSAQETSTHPQCSVVDTKEVEKANATEAESEESEHVQQTEQSADNSGAEAILSRSNGADYLGQFRSMGTKVMIATVAVLAAGVTIKMASLNR